MIRHIPLLDPIPGRQRPHQVLNGLFTAAAVVLAVIVALYYGYTRVFPLLSPSGQTVTADFHYAPALLNGDEVRVRGVLVGKVVGIGRDTAHNLASIKMLITDSSVHLKRDAGAQILWRTLLGGNMYVNLNPGSPSAPALDGPIPASQTDSQVEFDQLLSPFTHPRREAVRTTLGSFSTGFSAAHAVTGSVAAAAPALSAVASGVSAVEGSQPGDLQALVAHAGRMFGALSRDEASLAGLVDSADVTVGVTAARREAIGTTVAHGPAALSDTYTTMQRLRRTLTILDPLVQQLRPGARVLGSSALAARRALSTATPFLRTARPTLTQLHGALVDLGHAGAPGRRVFTGLDPAVANLQQKILPWLMQRDSVGLKNYEAIGPMFSDIDSAAQEFTGFGHLLRFQGFAGGERSLGLPCETFFADPTAPARINCDSLSGDLKTLLGGAGAGSVARTARSSASPARRAGRSK